jgi:hypothetical protein
MASEAIIKVEVSEFKEALDLAWTSVAKRSSMPALKTVELEAKGENLWIFGTDLVTSLLTRIDAETNGFGTITSLKTLINGLQSLKLKKGQTVHLKAPTMPTDSKFLGMALYSTIMGEPVILVPFASEHPEGSRPELVRRNEKWLRLVEWKGKESVKRLYDSLKFVFSAAYLKEDRPQLNCVALEGKNLVATDSHRIHVVEDCGGKEFGFVDKVDLLMIPSSTKTILKALEPNPNSAVLSIYGTNWRLDTLDTVIQGKIPDVRFPPYDKVIPKKNDAYWHLHLDANELLNAIKIVGPTKGEPTIIWRIDVLSKITAFLWTIDLAIMDSLSNKTIKIGAHLIRGRGTEENRKKVLNLSSPNQNMMAFNGQYWPPALSYNYKPSKSRKTKPPPRMCEITWKTNTDAFRVDGPGEGVTSVVMPLRL